ncbi:MAG: ABC transporter ATP-binding protein [Phycisphaerae bacterium]
MIVLETDKIRKEFGSTVAVNDLSLSIYKGQVWGLIGPNGAGKTTLLRMLATLLRPTSGTAKLLGHNLASNFLAIRKQIGFMPDFFNLYGDLKLWECLEFFAQAYGVEPRRIPDKIKEVLEFVDLQEKRDSLMRHLSRGMVQRMGVAVMLVHEPEIFLLDEPASGLDPKARIQLRQILTRLSRDGKTVIISSHILTEMSGFCSHIAIIDRGSIVVQGSVEEIQSKLSGAIKVIIRVIDNPQQAAEIVSRFPSAKLLTSQDNTITAELVGTESDLAILNTRLVNNGVKVSAFYEEKINLEDLFMKITSNKNEPVQNV